MKNIVILSFSIFIILFGLFSWNYLLPIYLKDLGASDNVVGFAYTLFALGITAFQIFGGYLSDRFGNKRTIVFPTFFLVPVFILMFYAENYQTVIGLFFISNVLSAIQIPAMLAYVSESDSRLGYSFGIFEMFIIAGISLGPIIGSLLLNHIEIKYLFLITAGLSFIGALLRAFFLVESPKIEKRGYSVSFKNIFKSDLKWYLIVATINIFIFSLTIHGPFLSLFCKESFSFSGSTINLIFGLGNLLAAVFCIPVGKRLDKINFKNSMGLFIIAHPLLLVLWYMLDGIPIIFILALPFAEFIYIVNSMIICKKTKSNNRGRILGFFGMVGGLFAIMAPYLGTKIRLWFGDIYVLALALVLGIVASAILFTRVSMKESLPLRP